MRELAKYVRTKKGNFFPGEVVTYSLIANRIVRYNSMAKKNLER